MRNFNLIQNCSKGKKCIFFTLLAFFLLIGPKVFAQGKEVKGVVKDETQFPIVGATVHIVGTTQGTITDIDGKFKLFVPSDTIVIQVSFIGKESQNLNIAGKDYFEVILRDATESINEVVVMGYGVQRKSDITGSVSSVKAKELTKVASIGVDQAIQGRAAGVQVSATSGRPGAGIDIKIRGIGTVGNSNPLYVVDGVPTSTIEFLNPSDIESLEILKDASATAIYGSRGANGVVLITSKKGSKDHQMITYDGYFGIQSANNTLNLANAEQYATLINEGRRADGLPVYDNMEDPSALGEGTDWIDEGTQTSMIQNHNIGFSGGSEKFTYNASANYLDQEGTLINSEFQRLSFRLNSTYQLKSWLEVGNNLTYVNFEGKGVYQNEGTVMFQDFITANPMVPVKFDDGSWGYDENNPESKNPVAMTYLQTPDSEGNQFVGNVYAKMNLAEGLVFKTSYGVDNFTNIVEVLTPKYRINDQQFNDQNSFQSNSFERKSWVWTNTLNYLADLNEDHRFNFLLGHEMQETKNTYIDMSVYDIPDALLGSKFIGAGDASTSMVDGRESESALLSFFGRVNYNYMDRLLFTANFRADGSSRFGENNRWGYFPSFALGWNLHQENFMESLDFVSRAKFRAGWGQIGNQNIGDFAFLTSVKDGYLYYFGDSSSASNGKAPTTVGNPDIKWETTTSSNFGVDLGFLDNKISVTADYFYKKTTDMLVQVPVPDYLGVWDSPFANAGEVENKGFEFSATWRGRKNDFSFDVSGNISFIQNEVLSLGDGGKAIFNGVSKTDVGQPIASFWGYKAVGIYQSESEIDAYLDQTGSISPGDVKYADLNGDKKIDAKDQTWIGSPHPDFFYGINVNLDYKNWSMSIFGQGTYGNDVYNLVGKNMVTNFNANKPDYYIENRWTGPETSNKYPRLTATKGQTNKYASSLFVEDASYFRLKNVQLAYQFKSDIAEKLYMKSLKVYISGQNLLTFTDYKGFDPELGRKQKSVGFDYYNSSYTSFGVDKGALPQARIFMVGLKAAF